MVSMQFSPAVHTGLGGGRGVLMLIPFNVSFVKTYVRRGALFFLVQASVRRDS